MDNNELDHGRPPTPPHHPTAGVRVLRQEIEDIVKFGLPDYNLVSISQIASGKSFNNRIYFLQLKHSVDKASSSPGTLSQPEQVVLKVNGRFFGANKIKNEVSCLRLLQRYCPDVPSPRALAWSEDGHVATYATSSQTRTRLLDIPPGVEKLKHGGWILMSHIPGNPMPIADLNDATLTDLAKQLGDIVACLRRDIPPQKRCGNIRLPQGGIEEQSVPVADGTALTIRDIIQDGIEVDEPITTANEYYRVRLVNKLRELKTTDVYAPNRSLIETIRAFISDQLPHLELTDGDGIPPGEFVLTHYDLSARNVLVSGQPPRITGLVDFEFAGFFPPVDEFLNDDVVNEGGEWPREFYKAYLARLHENGIATPVRGFDPSVWKRNCWLERLVGGIAPWYLPGGWKGEELQAKLREAEADVREVLKRLIMDYDEYKERRLL
ncbi:kinase-like domain-containing protein [Ilyonectria robusta]|uniref:kinase-like domain-containing protein n=1 Tax=Ilyonectria robusta TaxID=1079257 RepID=UPI001E8E233E|nr:kinase-like domain-containing protein [Ilyonectria robusta]KAH8729918.1 kinase-like domain-containing protein [Ilyonectria robusta]